MSFNYAVNILGNNLLIFPNKYDIYRLYSLSYLFYIISNIRI